MLDKRESEILNILISEKIGVLNKQPWVVLGTQNRFYSSF